MYKPRKQQQQQQQHQVIFKKVRYLRDKMALFETLLDELYRVELLFQIEEEEVNFIKTGIETLVQIIADLIWKNCYKTIEAETENITKKYPGLQISRNGKYTISDIIKAGSFYENTKNVYPDQFDYIFLMGVFESTRIFVENEKHSVTNVCDLHNCCRDLLTTCDISYPALNERRRCVRFDRYIERKGPASRLRFIYCNHRTEKFIHVDLVPAFKVLLHDHIDEIADKCGINGFKEEVKVSSNIILVQEHISFVETEVNFMKYMLSSKHIKAYRLLKYIMNGCYNENIQARCTFKSELLKALSNSKPNLVPSYHLKRVAISHHYECMNDNCQHFAQCLFQMMDRVKHITFISSVRKLYELFIGRPLTATGYRQELLDKTIYSFKELETHLTKRTSPVMRDSDSLLGKSIVEYNSPNNERNGRCYNLNEAETQVKMQLLNHEGKVAEQPNIREQKGHVKHIDHSNLTNMHGGKKHKQGITEGSAPRASCVLYQEKPLLSITRESDGNYERTKASDWFKTLSTYCSNVIVILFSGIFAVLVLYVLSYRA